ncbi:enoyl-CoA hydratase/isomerase family protein [Tamaricihabitans halophyticus]|uniref:enoyl-CoA hydratase/isomerase family protein n=1 Tax=Tamaricihabitans halophyticus TaxID=1262583 RepID=UPI00311F2208
MQTFGNGTIEFDIDADIASITLNRPKSLNAVVPELVDGLCRAIDEAIRLGAGALVLGGHGRAFCAGHDLKQEEPTDPMRLHATVARIQDVTRAVRRAPFPVIAMVHGYALGAGCEFALCSDLVVAARSAEFGFPEVGVGLSVTGGISQLLPLTVGLAKAKELVLLGERFSAERAAQLGLINSVVPDDQLRESTWDWARRLADRPRLATTLAKHALDNGSPGDIAAAFEIELGHAVVTQRSRESQLAQAKFAARGGNR